LVSLVEYGDCKCPYCHAAVEIASGATSTPTFFIDGMRYDGSLSLPKMLATIRELHPSIRVAEAPAQSPRIPRKRWAREVEKP